MCNLLAYMQLNGSVTVRDLCVRTCASMAPDPDCIRPRLVSGTMKRSFPVWFVHTQQLFRMHVHSKKCYVPITIAFVI